MASGIPTFAFTHDFAADAEVDPQVLAAQLALMAEHVNEQLKIAHDAIQRSDNTLGDGTIRQRHLHDEVGNVFTVLQAHADDGAAILQECRCATVANHALTGLAAFDGVTPIAGDRVLVRRQDDATQNGIYVAAAGAWARAADADAMDELGYAYTFVEEGTACGRTGWLCDVGTTGTIGTVAIAFKKIVAGYEGQQGPAGALTAEIPGRTVIGNIEPTDEEPAPMTMEELANILSDWSGATFGNYSLDLSIVTGLAALVEGHRGSVLVFDDAGPVTVTLPRTLPANWSVTIVQRGTGQLTFSPAVGATLVNRQGHTKTAGRYAVVSLMIPENDDDLSAQYVLAGDTAS